MKPRALVVAVVLHTPAHALTLRDLGPYGVDAESVVTVEPGATPSGILECDGLFGPAPGVRMRWDADRDGAWDVDWQNTGVLSQSVSFDVSAAGVDGPQTVLVPVQARCFQYDWDLGDHVEILVAGDVVIDVRNVAPVVGAYGVVGANPTALLEGSVYDFVATPTDVEPADVLSVTWRWSDGPVVVGNPAPRAFGEGAHTAEVVVSDDDGGLATALYEVRVANVAPTVSPLNLPVADEGREIELVGHASNPWDALTWTWTVGGTVLQGNPAAFTPRDDAVLPVTATVFDGTEAVAQAGTLTVRNLPPEPTLSGDVDDSAGTVQSWVAAPHDPGPDDTHTYDWDLGDGTTLTDAGPEVSHTFGTNGLYRVTVTVTDDDGGVGQAVLPVSIERFGRVITRFEVPARADEGDVLALHCEGEDRQGTGSLTTTWDLGGRVASGSPVTASWDDDAVIEVTCLLEDGAGQITTRHATLTIDNVAPALSGVPATDAVEGEVYAFAPGVSEPGADTLVFSGQVPAGATLDPGSGAVSWIIARGDLGPHDLSIEVRDDDGGADVLEWSVDVALLDVDGDGLGDFWETDVGLDPTDPSDATGDPDGDGRDNTQEFADQTDPFSDDSPGVPLLLDPADGGRVATARPGFVLQPAVSPPGDPLVYDLELLTELGAVIGAPTGLAEVVGAPIWTTPDPLDENAVYGWRARASDGFADGPWTTLASFVVDVTPEPPYPAAILWPPHGATVDTTTVTVLAADTGDPDREPVTYTFTVHDTGGALLETLADVEPVGDQVPVDVVLTEGQTACVEVVGIDARGVAGAASERPCFTVDTSNAAPSAPTFLVPADGAVVTSDRIDIELAPGVDPEGRAVWHRLEVDTAPGFDSEDLQVFDLGPTYALAVQTAPLPEDAWVQLRALASDGSATSGWSQIEVFVNADNQPPTVPRLVRPAPGLSVFGGAVVLETGGSIDPEGFEVDYEVEVRVSGQVDLVARLQEARADDDGRVIWRLPPLEPGVYAWTARTTDDLGAVSPDAEAQTFRVATPAELDNPRTVPDPVSDTAQPMPTGCGCAQSGGVGSRAVVTILVGLLGWRRRRR